MLPQTIRASASTQRFLPAMLQRSALTAAKTAIALKQPQARQEKMRERFRMARTPLSHAPPLGSCLTALGFLSAGAAYSADAL
jgi:hypothetical protein